MAMVRFQFKYIRCVNRRKFFFKNVLFGSVLGFRYVDGRTNKEKQYHSDFVAVLDETENKRQDIEVLAIWYALRTDGSLVSLASSLGTNINNFYHE